MSAANTISIRLEVQGTPQVLAQLKSVLTGVNSVKTGLTQAKSSMSGGFNLGPLQGLQNAIGQTEQKVSAFRATLGKISSGLQQNGAAFGVAAASVWGVYNAYDSLVKVEIRAAQAASRVMTTQTSLSAMENRLTEARRTGNLTAEEMAILEEKIINTKTRLAVAQQRSADLQGDVNEAWGAFASQVGPQVIAAAGSISQLVTTMRGSLTGVVPRIKDFIGGLTQTRISASLATGSTFQLSGALASAGPAGQVGAVGVRALSGAIKGLLIGTGIGAILVAIGLLTEGFGLLSESSAETSEKVVDNFDATTGEIKKYSDGFQFAFDSVSKAMEDHAAEVKKTQDAITATITEASIKRMLVAARETQAQYESLKKQRDDQLQIVQDLKDKIAPFDFLAEIIHGPALKEAETKLSSLQSRLDSVTSQFKAEGIAIKDVVTAFNAQNKAIQDNGEQWAQNTLQTNASFDSMEKMFTAVKRNVDLWLNQFTPAQLKAASAQETLTAQFEASGVSYQNNTELNAVATAHFDQRLKELFPDMEKTVKEQEKVDNKMQDLIDRAAELSDEFGVEIPSNFVLTERSLDQLSKTLQENQEILDEWNSHAEEFKNFGTAAKAFKIEFEMEKEVKDFIKDLPKDTEKKVKIILKREQGIQDFKAFFADIQSLFFRQNKTANPDGTISMDMIFRPIYNQNDAVEFRDQLLEQLEDMFGEGGEKGGVWAQKLFAALNSADTREEIINALQEAGLLIEDEITKVGTNAGTALGKSLNDKFGPLADAILNPKGGKNVVTHIDPNTGKQTLAPQTGGEGDTSAQVDAQTALQVALQKTQTALANLATQGANSLSILAKASSTAINGIINNLKVGEVASQKLQTGIANLSNQGLISLASLASSSSKAMQGFRNNLFVGETAAQKLQTGLANLANQGSRSLTALAQSSSTNMNGFVNNLNKGTEAVKRLQSAINSLKNKTVHIGLSGPGVKFLATGFHGIVDKPTIMVVGEAGAERVDVSPVVGGHGTGLTADRNVRIEPVGKIETTSTTRREIVHDNGRSGPQVIQLVSYTYLFPNSSAYKRSVQEYSLDDLTRFSQS